MVMAPRLIRILSPARRRVVALIRRAVRHLSGGRLGKGAREQPGAQQELISRLFDRGWYLGRYADVRRAKVDALRHYLRHGWKEGRMPHPFFDVRWYLRRYPDVREAEVEPLRHYLQYGWHEGREPHPFFDAEWLGLLDADEHTTPLERYLEKPEGERVAPSPMFDPDWYLEQNPDVAAAGTDPVTHFFSYGMTEGRCPHPDLSAAWTANPPPDRLPFGAGTLMDADDVIERTSELLRRPQTKLVSVIMPAWNRESCIQTAIESVRGQTYRNWELIVVDDGSEDGTADRVDAISDLDGRVKVVRAPHGGVSAARNTGLRTAAGDLVAYLDTDNVWHPSFLLLVVNALTDTAADCAYAAMTVHHQAEGHRVFVVGRPLDVASLRRSNYVDLNVFLHTRRIWEERGGFDEELLRWVDWDLALRYVEAENTVFVPATLCRYTSAGASNQISQVESDSYRDKVHLKHLIDWTSLRASVARRQGGRVSVIIVDAPSTSVANRWLDEIRQLRDDRIAELVVVVPADSARFEIADEAAEPPPPVCRVVPAPDWASFALRTAVALPQTTGESLVVLNGEPGIVAGWVRAVLDAFLESSELDAACTVPDADEHDASGLPANRGGASAPAERCAPGPPEDFCLALRAGALIHARGIDPTVAEDLSGVALAEAVCRSLPGAGQLAKIPAEPAGKGTSPAVAGRPGSPYQSSARGASGGVGSLAEPGPPAIDVGFVTMWHKRGIAIQTRQLADSLERYGFRTHIFARWESARFDNSGTLAHPRVYNAGEDPSPEETLAWARGNRIALVMFMEVHPNDWKRVAALAGAGVRIGAYENLDILPASRARDYGVFELMLHHTFSSHRWFTRHVPNHRGLLIPWGVPEERLVARQPARDGQPLRYLHVSGWGGVNDRKRSALALRAFDRAGPPNAELHFYTQRTLPELGEDLPSIAGANPSIRVHEGGVDDLFPVYAQSDVLLWPSVREGLGLPIVEALASGLVVLTADGYMMQEWFEPNRHGLLCPSRAVTGGEVLPEYHVDERCVADLIARVARDQEEYRRMARAVAQDRALWAWNWQPGILGAELRRVVRSRHYQPPDPSSYVPAPRLALGRAAEIHWSTAEALEPAAQKVG